MLRSAALLRCACSDGGGNWRWRHVRRGDVARSYIAAYSSADWDGMAALMSEDVEFVDRTNPDPNAIPVYRGRSAVLAMLHEFGETGGVVELGFDFPQEFESNGIAVFSGRVNTLSVAPGASIGYRWRADQVIALTVRDGKVVRHEDFADYAHAVIETVQVQETTQKAVD
ncbi:MAG: nuclear transport factor 2 family protein [Parvularculaceae bacterium]